MHESNTCVIRIGNQGGQNIHQVQYYDPSTE